MPERERAETILPHERGQERRIVLVHVYVEPTSGAWLNSTDTLFELAFAVTMSGLSSIFTSAIAMDAGQALRH